VDSSGNPLPAAVLLTQIGRASSCVARPAVAANELERFEACWYVSKTAARRVHGRVGDIAIVADDTRAFREPGLEYPAAFAYPIVWDGTRRSSRSTRPGRGCQA